MKMPPRGERYVAATWIAIGVAVAVVAIGTTLLLARQDRLPDRIVVRWDDFEPDRALGLEAVVLLGCVVVIGSCLLTLVVGWITHRSVRGLFAAHAVGLSVWLGIGIYGVTLAQVSIAGSDVAPTWMAIGVPAGAAAGWLLARWIRMPPDVTEEPPADQIPTRLVVPASARIAWVGRMRMAWSVRLGWAVLMLLPALVFLLMGGLPVRSMLSLILAVLVGRLIATKPHQLAVDYSGVGLRGARGGAPGAIKMAEIRSADVTAVSALRDFGGWGRAWSGEGAEGWITRSGEALVVHRRNKPDLVYTVDGAEEAAAVLNTLLARSEVA